MSKTIVRSARRLLGDLLALLLPADCLICTEPLPWDQKGSVCRPCWSGLPWSPGLRRRAGARRALDATVWAADYDGPVRRLIQALKFEGADALGLHLGTEAAARLGRLLGGVPSAEAAAPLPHPDLVVPVPLHWRRRLGRGFNQAMLIAAPMARGLGVPLAPRLLRRRRAGRRQLGLSRAERLRSLAGCYRIPGHAGTRAGLRGATVLLVDDVVTTGATLEACARELRLAGALRVIGCALARTP